MFPRDGAAHLRLFEHRGKSTTVRLHAPSGGLTNVDLAGPPKGKVSSRFGLSSWQIRTVRMEVPTKLVGFVNRTCGFPVLHVSDCGLTGMWITSGLPVNQPERQQALDRLDGRGKLPQRTFGREAVKAPILYRIAAVLLLLFAVAHTLGFRQSDPKWGVDALLGSMRSIHFDMQGFSRTYWDLFVAAGFSVGVFYLFAAVLAWQLGGLPAATLAVMRGTAWAFALCFAAITVVSWRYLFILPIVFSVVITVCLTAAAWLSAKTS